MNFFVRTAGAILAPRPIPLLFARIVTAGRTEKLGGAQRNHLARCWYNSVITSLNWYGLFCFIPVLYTGIKPGFRTYPLLGLRPRRLKCPFPLKTLIPRLSWLGFEPGSHHQPVESVRIGSWKKGGFICTSLF